MIRLWLLVPAAAFPSFRDAIPNGRRVPCPPNSQGCQPGDPTQCEAESSCNGVGHQTCEGGTLPLNSFGQAFANAGHSWTRELCEADSDGDGRSNGEELGDPCCLWRAGDAPSEYTKRFMPSHPGHKDSVAKDYVRPECATTGTRVKGHPFGEFNENEVQLSLDLRIEPYQVPSVTTSYIDFAFNMPDEAWTGGEDFSVVRGDALLDQVAVVHHFVITACSEKFPPEMHGKQISPMAGAEYGCDIMWSAWAPGAAIASMPPWIGMPIGPKAGVVAFTLQIHYNNVANTVGLVDSSGMRLWYTSTPRPYPLVRFSTMQLSTQESLVIPAQRKRWFVTRECSVSVLDDKDKPAEMHVIGVSYHAHLLAKEMYSELIPVDGGTPIDLGSERVWYYDDQYTRDLSNLNITLRTGDRLQSTCVMSSDDKEVPFGLETTDEMCWANYQGWSPSGAARVSCSGPVWSGQLLEGEPGFGLASRRPASTAINVFDGRDDLTGGAPKRLGGKDVHCQDMMSQCSFVAPFVLSAGEHMCTADLSVMDWGIGDVLPAGVTALDMCCKSTCNYETCKGLDVCLELLAKEESSTAALTEADAVVKQLEPFVTIRTSGCSSDAVALKSVQIALPEELVAEPESTPEGSSSDNGSDSSAAAPMVKTLAVAVGISSAFWCLH